MKVQKPYPQSIIREKAFEPLQPSRSPLLPLFYDSFYSIDICIPCYIHYHLQYLEQHADNYECSCTSRLVNNIRLRPEMSEYLKFRRYIQAPVPLLPHLRVGPMRGTSVLYLVIASVLKGLVLNEIVSRSVMPREVCNLYY